MTDYILIGLEALLLSIPENKVKLLSLLEPVSEYNIYNTEVFLHILLPALYMCR
jgi:hypothetical protein